MLAVRNFEKRLVLEGLRLGSLKTDFPGLDSRSIQKPRQLSGQYDHPSIDRRRETYPKSEPTGRNAMDLGKRHNRFPRTLDAMA